jgi:hypothetical protein
MLDPFTDLTWYNVDTATWTIAETGVYLIASCLPSLRFLFKPLFKELDLHNLRCFLSGGDSRDLSQKSVDHRISIISTSTIGPTTNAYFERLGDRATPDPTLYSTLPESSELAALAACYSAETEIHHYGMGLDGKGRIHMPQPIYELDPTTRSERLGRGLLCRQWKSGM